MTQKPTINLPLVDIIEWDVLNWSELIKEWGSVIEGFSVDSKVLAIGERNGGLALWLALQGFNVVCTDVVDVSKRAHMLHERYKVSDKITYAVLDIVNDTNEKGVYDIIIGKSVIGGVKSIRNDASTRSFETQQTAIQNISDMLKKDGVFLSAENMEGGAVVQFLRSRKQQCWLYLKYDELQTLYKSFSSIRIKTFGILPTLFQNTTVNSIAYWFNRRIFNNVSDKKKYISFITAKK